MGGARRFHIGQVVAEERDLPIVVGKVHRAAPHGHGRNGHDIDRVHIDHAFPAKPATSRPLPTVASQWSAISPGKRQRVFRTQGDLRTGQIHAVEQDAILGDRMRRLKAEVIDGRGRVAKLAVRVVGHRQAAPEVPSSR